jgi:DNA-binding MarR family transcriptional regulator
MAAQPLAEKVFASFRALGAEIDHLDQAAADRFGLNRTDMRALEIISSAGQVAPTTLARRLGFTTGGVTSVVDRLEQAGYVRRRADTSDRRRQVLEATELAATRELEIFGALIGATRKLLKSYSKDQLLVVQDFLEKTYELTAAHAGLLARDAAAQRGRG